MDELYYGYYSFGLSLNKPIWDWDIWKDCIPLIHPIIDLSPNIPSINSSQAISVPYGKNYASYKDLRFGRLIYNEKNNEVWATKYVNEPDWTFFYTEIVHPTFSYCDKHGVDPDIFIKVSNENLGGTALRKINQSIVVLFKKKLADDTQLKTIENSIEMLNDKLGVLLYGKIIRPAQYPDDIAPKLASRDYIRHSPEGALDYENLDFSKRFKQYGMQTIQKASF